MTTNPDEIRRLKELGYLEHVPPHHIAPFGGPGVDTPVKSEAGNLNDACLDSSRVDTPARGLRVMEAHLAADCPDRDNCWAASIHDEHDPRPVDTPSPEQQPQMATTQDGIVHDPIADLEREVAKHPGYGNLDHPVRGLDAVNAARFLLARSRRPVIDRDSPDEHVPAVSDYTDEARLRDVLDPLLIHHTGIPAPEVDPIVDEFVAAVQQVWSAELSLLREQNANLRESAETAVFVANNLGDARQVEQDRRENDRLHYDAQANVLRAERDALQAEVERLIEVVASMDRNYDELAQENLDLTAQMAALQARIDAVAVVLEGVEGGIRQCHERGLTGYSLDMALVIRRDLRAALGVGGDPQNGETQ